MRYIKMLTMLVAALAMNLATYAQEAFGLCGDNLTWEYESDVLIISGSGEMWNFSVWEVPWNNYKNAITEINLYGANSIGNEAFSGCSNLQSITIPASVTVIGDNAFANCTNLATVTFEEGWLNTIGYSAFNGCSSLSSINIPASVSQISANAFSSCENLKTVTFADGSSLQIIGDAAFYYCGIHSIDIPASVTTIGDYAFASNSPSLCVSFAEGSALQTIGEYAFYNCQMSQIKIPASVQTIGSNAFGVNPILSAVYVNWPSLSGVTVAGDAFSGFHEMEMTLYIPYGRASVYTGNPWDAFANIVEINPSGQCGDNLYWLYDPSTTTLTITGTGAMWDYTASTQPWSAFRNEMTTISLPAGITHVGNNAFVYCTSVTSPVTIPASVESMGSYAFAQCDFATVTFESGSQLTTIGLNAFYRCASLTAIEIPAGVTYIGDLAFSKATSLATVTFAGNSLTTIEGQVFSDCTSLSSITLPAGVTTIEDFAFSGCSSLSSIVLPASLTTIEEYAFEMCTLLTAIDIPIGVTNINYYAFKECSSLANVTVHWTSVGDLPTVGHDMFYEIASPAQLHVPCGTTSLYSAADQWSSFTIDDPCPSGQCGENLTWQYNSDTHVLTITGSGAMYDYNSGGAPWNSYRANITSVSLPAGMTHIGNYAFYWCSIQTATFETGSLLETIGNYAFYYCSSLTAIDIPVGVTSLGVYSFGRCSKLETVTFAAGSPLTAINNYAFSYCSSLTAIDIPVGVTSIGEYAFSYCSSLTAIDIPVGVTSIGMCAFYQCYQLANVTVHWDAPITPGSYAFNYKASGATLHVPCGTSANYAAAPWNSFNIVEYGCVASADYTRPALTAGKIGTLYVGHATASYEGATFYSIVGKSADGRSLTFEEVSGQLEDDKPYIFEASGEDIKLYYADDSYTAPDEANHNGLYGTLTTKHVGPSADIYYISENKLWRANGFSGGATDLTVGANRCWIDIRDVPVGNPVPAPGRRYITLRTDGEMTATGLEEVGSETANAVRSEKILRDGQLLIIHGDKTYNALGQTVQ